uniref:Transposase of ISCARN111, IS110 family IS1111 group n=1 Tax=mine drainage metagenome TaxID=410659 RepID=E6QW38_9ZZZZ
MNIITVGIDLAKNVFAVHGVDDNGKPVLVKPKVTRADLLPLIANLPPCLIGMEACSGAHHWARQFRQHGHTVKLMAPKFVAPYRMTGKKGKNDAADAAAICEAVTRPTMLFVPIKEEHQQIILCLHRTRQGFVEERTACYNRLRGLIAEFGIVLPQKVTCLRREIGAHLEDLPSYANLCVCDLLSHTADLDTKIAEYDRAIAQAAKEDARSKRLMSLPGIGPSPPVPCSPASATDTTSITDAKWRHGSASCRGSTAAVARRDWGASPRPETATCAASWSWVRGQCSTALATSRTDSAAGPDRCRNGAATGAR